MFQIAAHEDVVPVPTLYRWCQTARDWFDSHGVGMGRVIARPFVGQPGSYTRTANRHDYAAAPPSATYMDALAQAGVPALSVGKPYDIFLGRGFSAHEKTASNTDGLAKTLAALPEAHGLIFTNLVDFDSKWGHRRNAEAYAAGLEEVDCALPALMVVQVWAGVGRPGRANQPLYCSRPSLSRRASSFRSYRPEMVWPSSSRIRTSRGKIRDLSRSIP